MPVIALLNQKGGVGKTTLSIHLAAAIATGNNRPRVLLVDADPQASALDWSAQREAEKLFPVIGLPKDTLHKELAAFRKDYDWIVIDGPPRVNAIAKSAIIASDLVVIPVQPSPFDIWAAKEVIDIVEQAGPLKPDLIARFLVNRLFLNTTLGAEIKDALGSFQVPAFSSTIRNRQEYAKAARTGLTALETEPAGPAAQEIRLWAREIKATLTQEHRKEKMHAAS